MRNYVIVAGDIPLSQKNSIARFIQKMPFDIISESDAYPLIDATLVNHSNFTLNLRNPGCYSFRVHNESVSFDPKRLRIDYQPHSDSRESHHFFITRVDAGKHKIVRSVRPHDICRKLK